MKIDYIESELRGFIQGLLDQNFIQGQGASVVIENAKKLLRQPVKHTTEVYCDDPGLLAVLEFERNNPEPEFGTETMHEAMRCLIDHAKECETKYNISGDAVIEMAEIVLARNEERSYGDGYVHKLQAEIGLYKNKLGLITPLVFGENDVDLSRTKKNILFPYDKAFEVNERDPLKSTVTIQLAYGAMDEWGLIKQIKEKRKWMDKIARLQNHVTSLECEIAEIKKNAR